MPQPFDIQFTDPSTGNVIQVKGEITDGDWEKLLRFKEYAEQLLELRAIKDGMQVKCNFKTDAKGGIDTTCEFPPDDDIAAFLHRMRPFILQKEPTSFFKVSRILHDYFDHPLIRKIIKKNSDLFSGKDFQSQIQIKINDVLINSDTILTKWLNAFEYHRDTEKQRELEELHKLIPLEYSKAIFISMIIDKAKAVLEINRMIKGLEHRSGIEMKHRI